MIYGFLATLKNLLQRHLTSEKKKKNEKQIFIAVNKSSLDEAAANYS